MADTRSASLILSHALDSLDLTDDHVRSRISKFSKLEVLANAVDFQPDHQNTILTGSIMDGVGWKGYMTDIDSMLRFRYVMVCDNVFERSNVDDQHIFEMEDEKVHLGYTRLRLEKEGPLMEHNIFSLTPKGAKSYCYEENGNFYLSSHSFKTAFNRYQVIPERPPWVMQSSYNYAVSFPDEEEILEHGPSLCFTDDTKEEPSHDSVPCFHCPVWPKQAEEWQSRSPRNWPSEEAVKSVVSKGCDVVPVGSLGSKTRGLEWRLSFALSEKELIQSFNNTQHKCYSLLKMILKEIVDKQVPNVLSSFQMKNALLWTVEKSEKELWCKERLTEAIMTCLSTMHTFIKDGNAPSYFIPKNNVLEKRMTPDEQTTLLNVFNDFLKEGWTCLLQCTTLTEANLPKLLQEYTSTQCLENVLGNGNLAEHSKIWFDHDLALFPRFEDARLEIMSSIGQGDGDIGMTITRHQMMLQQLEERSVNQYYREVLRPIVASVESSLGSHLYALSLENNGENSKTSMTREIEYLLAKGMKSDAAAGKLKYAYYLYMTGNILECQQLAQSIVDGNHSLSAHNPHFLPVTYGPSETEITKYQEFMTDNTMCTEDRYLTSAYHAVVFLPTEIPIAPPAIKFQLNSPLPEPLRYTSWLSWAIYDPKVFAYYLIFLCQQKVGQNELASEALGGIEKLLEAGDVGYEVSALNMLGYSYITMRNNEKGIPFLLKAMSKAITPESMIWQMGQELADKC